MAAFLLAILTPLRRPGLSWPLLSWPLLSWPLFSYPETARGFRRSNTTERISFVFIAFSFAISAPPL
jgi:hypothetical protein